MYSTNQKLKLFYDNKSISRIEHWTALGNLSKNSIDNFLVTELLRWIQQKLCIRCEFVNDD